MFGVAHSLRYALRTLRRAPGFTAVVILILAVGIGANVAMFSVVHAVFLKALPFQDPSRLVLARPTFGGQVSQNVSSEDYYDFRDQVRAFESLAAILSHPVAVTVTGGQEPERVPVTLASIDLFPTLGVSPRLGRQFSRDEAVLSAPDVILISHGYWQRRFGGSPDVLGRTLVINGAPCAVVGVMPAGFHLLYEVDIWMPMRAGGSYTGVRRFHNWTVVGRLRPGVTLQQAQGAVDVVAAQLANDYPESNANKGLRIFGLQDALTGSYDEMLFMLMGAIALVLLIACGNVAGLLLARGVSRSAELSVRVALGASPRRIAGQLLIESSVMALGAGILGAALAVGLLRLLLGILPLDRLGVQSVGVSAPMLLFAAVLTLATAVVFGTIPAVTGARADPAERLKSGARSTGGTGVARFRSGFVILQVALSVVLLIGAGLLLRSFVKLRGLDPGFRTERLLTARIGLGTSASADAGSRARFFEGLLEDIRAIPGVQAAGATSRLPIKDGYSNVRAWDPANPPADPSTLRLAERRAATPGYFEAMGIPILAGRDVEYKDADPVIVINQAMSRGLFEGQNPVGRQVAVDIGEEEPAIARVIGVVGDVRMTSLASEPGWQMYLAHHQFAAGTMSVAVRAHGDPAALTNAVRAVLRARDPDIPLADVATMEAVIAGSIADARVVMMVLAVFAAVAVLLAAIGLYSVLAYYVACRAHEIGIRLALGATPGNVLRLVLGKGLVLVTAGLAVGLTGAVGLTRFVQGQLYGVQPVDTTTFAGVGLLFGAIGAVACLIPGWRAARVDPMRTLQAE